MNIGPSHYRLFFWILLLLCAALGSCEFESNHTYFKTLPVPDGSGIEAELETFPDTFWVGPDTRLGYREKIGKRAIQYIAVYMDNAKLGEIHGYGDIVSLYSSNYADGFHQLRVEYFLESNSGSLADQVGAESLVVKKNHVAVIERAPAQAVPIVAVEARDGTLAIRWSRYKAFNFQSYVLAKQMWNGDGYSDVWNQEITNKNRTLLNDSTYLGGKVQFVMKVKTIDGKLGPSSQQVFDFDYSPGLAFEWQDIQHVKLTWHKAPFYKNFQSYELGYGDYKTTTDINDTTAVETPLFIFPEPSTIFLTIKARGGYPLVEGVSVTPTSKFPPFNGSIVYNSALGKYFTMTYLANSRSTLSRIDGTSLQVEQTYDLTDGTFALSDNGMYLYVSQGRQFKLLNPLDFSETAVYDIDAIAPPPLNSIQVADNNVITIRRGAISVAMAMPGKTVLLSNVTDNPYYISPSGNHLAGDGHLWSWDGTQFNSVLAVEPSFRAVFRDDRHVMLQRIQGVDMIELASGKLVAALPLRGGNLVYDKVSDLLGFDDYKYRLFNAATGEEVTSFPVLSHSSWVYSIANNKIICTNGTLLPLSYYYP